MRLLAALAAPLMVLALSACGAPADETAEPDAAPEATPVMPMDAPPQEEAPAEVTPAATDVAPGACRDEIGETASAKLVQRCIAVSPATHPPCNADNPCALIQNEIDRSCAMFADDPPAECAA